MGTILECLFLNQNFIYLGLGIVKIMVVTLVFALMFVVFGFKEQEKLFFIPNFIQEKFATNSSFLNKFTLIQMMILQALTIFSYASGTLLIMSGISTSIGLLTTVALEIAAICIITILTDIEMIRLTF